MVYRERAGEQERFAHPFPGGDACTVVRASAGLLASVSGGEPDAAWDTAPRPPLVDAQLHRLRTACKETGDVTERVVRLLAATVALQEPERVQSGRPATDGARRAIVHDVRLLLQHDLHAGLLDAARHAGVSPHHLSRIFTRLTGVTFTEYRTRLRVRRALMHLEDGEHDLAALAQRTGFADHAHLTRTLRAHTGLTPSALRAQVSS